MSITDDMLVDERPNLGGVQRRYRLPNGYGLSAISAAMLRSYPFAWEIAVLKPEGGGIAYDTPLTDDVEVFATDDEANAFIAKAKAWAEESAS